jgi:hypothetical protein
MSSSSLIEDIPGTLGKEKEPLEKTFQTLMAKEVTIMQSHLHELPD